MTSFTFHSDEDNHNQDQNQITTTPPSTHHYDLETGMFDVYNNNTNNYEEIIDDLDNNYTNIPILNNVTNIFNNIQNPINIITYYDNNSHYSIQNQNMILPVTIPQTHIHPHHDPHDNNYEIVIVTPTQENNNNTEP